MPILKDQDVNDSIRLKIVFLEAYTRTANQEGLTDVNKYLEDFFCGLFNILYDHSLINLNLEKYNHPSVDLGDKNKKLAIQVTSNNSREKVVDTLKKFKKHKLEESYDQLEIFIIGDKRKISDVKTDISYKIWDISDLIQEIDKKDTLIQQKVLQYLSDKVSNISENIPLTTVESEIFKKIFTKISTHINQSNVTPEALSVRNSDLEKKKTRFQPFWNLIEKTYRAIISKKIEQSFLLATSHLSPDELDTVKEYLAVEGDEQLLLNDNPVEAINSLQKKIIADSGLIAVSQTYVKYFLYYQLYNCYLFSEYNGG